MAETLAHGKSTAVYNPTVVLFAASFLLFAVNLILALSTDMWSGAAGFGLVAVQSILLYVLFTPMHEAVHRVASKRRWLNEAILAVTGLCFASDGRLFRRIHLAHHAYTNRGAIDPDHFTAHPRLVWRWVKSFALVGHYYRYVLTQLRKAVGLRQAMVSVAIPVVALLAAVAAGKGQALMLGWLVPWFLAQGVLGFVFTSWPHHPGKDSSRVGNTRILLAPKAVQWLMLSQNLHLVHHYKPDVPWYRYDAYWQEHGAKLVAQGAFVETLGSPSRYHRA